MNNLTIRLKLKLTFLLISILLVLLASYSVLSVNKASNGFKEYRKMSKDSVLAAQVQSNMLQVSLSVKNYLANPIDEEIEKFNINFNKVVKSIDIAKLNIKDLSRLKLVKELDENAKEYKKSFFLISSINQERDDIIESNLDRNGDRIEQFLSDVMQRLEENKNMKTAIDTSRAIKMLLIARVYTTKFLNSYSSDDLAKVKKAFEQLSEQIKIVESGIDDSFLSTRLRLAKRFISVYQNGSIKIEEIITERNEVIDGRLKSIGLNMAKLAEDIKSSIKKEQESIGLEVSTLNSAIQNITIAVSFVILIFIIVISIIIPRNISNLIDTFQEGLINFFKYLNNENDSVHLIAIDSKDEIGSMSTIINKNITLTKIAIDQDSEMIEDVKRVVMLVKEGKVKQEVTKSTNNERLEELKTIFNDMLDVMSQNVCEDLNNITHALNQYQNLDFTYRIENQNGKMAEGLNILADIINKMLVDNKSNGLALDESSDILLKNVNILNQNTEHSAAALEETAAAIEDVTNNIVNNTNNISQMTQYAKELNDSVNEGETLSNQTTSAMNDINEEVNSIYDAISVIDQIAFQTNILSLNAAVEAATAGEAGKGFAVVAGEVRNLAARSAEAASEIKGLVESATKKADTGKTIASQMIDGYVHLKDNISKTIELISSIEDNSKGQKAGIEQINAAITTLDNQTQENANISNKTHMIALETDTLAKLIVSDVNEKEFIGKDEIQAKVIKNEG